MTSPMGDVGGIVVLTAAVYARFSSDLQDSTSIEDQERVCREAAPRLGIGILEDHHYRDEEMSGANVHRPAIKR
jgi:site-specific DNA recombinase